MPVHGAILDLVDRSFASAIKPEHFTNYRHCDECREHDDLLRMRDRETLTIQDVGNAGWDPICFISPEGFAYYFPALARIALADPRGPEGWYGPQLLFHLTSEGDQGRFVQHFTPEQRQAVAAVLAYILEAQWDRVLDYLCDHQLQSAIDIWSKPESQKEG